MSPLISMRLTGLTRTGRAIAPLLGGMVVLAIFYGGGAARPAEAYGLSAIVLFPVLAWQTKILLEYSCAMRWKLRSAPERSTRTAMPGNFTSKALATFSATGNSTEV